MLNLNGEAIGKMENIFSDEDGKKFENKLFILINESKKYYLESYDSLIAIIFGKEYKNLSFEEKYIIRFKKALPITIELEKELVDTRVGRLNSNGKVLSDEFSFTNAFIIDNDKTFILSLLKFKNILLLEKKNENIFYIEGIIKDLEKSNIKGINEYIVINEIIDKLLLLNMKLKD